MFEVLSVPTAILQVGACTCTCTCESCNCASVDTQVGGVGRAAAKSAGGSAGNAIDPPKGIEAAF